MPVSQETVLRQLLREALDIIEYHLAVHEIGLDAWLAKAREATK